MRRTLALAAAAVVAATGLALGTAPATAQEPTGCTTAWAAPVDGSWHDAARWTAGVPDGDDVACVDAVGTYRVDVGADSPYRHLRVGPGATVAATGPVTLGWVGPFVDGNVTVRGTLDLGTSGRLAGNGLHVLPEGRLHVTLASTISSRGSFGGLDVQGMVQLTTTVAPAPSQLVVLLGDSRGAWDPLYGGARPFTQVGPGEMLVRSGEIGLSVQTAAAPVRRLALGAYSALHPYGAGAPTFAADLARLEAGTIGLGGLARELSLSDPHRALMVNELYRSILGREPDRAGRDGWVRQIRLGRRTVTTAAASMLGSAEYGSASPDTPHWVGRVYQDVLGREPSPTDRALWADRADRLGRGKVAHRLLDTPEARRRRVGPLFQRALLRTPGPAERTYWADRLLATGDSDVLATLVASSEARALFAVRYRWY